MAAGGLKRGRVKELSISGTGRMGEQSDEKKRQNIAKERGVSSPKQREARYRERVKSIAQERQVRERERWGLRLGR